MALIDCHFKSETLDMQTAMYVIIPDASIQARQRRALPALRVLYLLHGLSDDHTVWQRRTSIERYVEQLELAVVMPNVHRSFYTNMVRGYRYWDFVSTELPRVVRALFPISDRREDTFAAGLSMGGYGAYKLALGKPESFAGAASLSGALAITGASQGSISEEWQNTFGEPDRVRGTESDLFHLVRSVAHGGGPKPKLYQCCGTEDFLYWQNASFRDAVQPLGLDYCYEEGPGAHEWSYWDKMIVRALEWLELTRSPVIQ
jgi:S-formylglutathione hydrolase FrmB